VGCLLAALAPGGSAASGSPLPLLGAVALAVAFTGIGFLDDLLIVRRGRNLGLKARQKLAGQFLFAIGFVAWVHAGLRPLENDLPGPLLWAWEAFQVLLIVGMSNAVNLTDGLDGLAAGASILVSAAYIFISFWQFRHTCDLLGGATGCYAVRGADMQDIAIVAAAMMGAATGFLWWNAAPARIFMGDTGALAIGGLFGALALATNTVLLLVIIGGLFVLETLSVIIQVISYRGFGRRVFRMSPFHHHFELAGWPEFTVIVRFWIIAGLCSAVGIGLFYADFIARGGLG
jgi:phospho-N-acetylmuramoyl-pentapeptide-transferase